VIPSKVAGRRTGEKLAAMGPRGGVTWTVRNGHPLREDREKEQNAHIKTLKSSGGEIEKASGKKKSNSFSQKRQAPGSEEKRCREGASWN